jgi:hypothetical protein
MDLLLKHEQIVIETKMTRDNLGQRKVAEELAIDKELYRSHQDCRTLGAYCASETGVPFGEYLELLEGLPSQELFDTSPEVFYQHTVAATWNTSITAAEQRAPLARPALEMTAYLAPEAIPRSFFAVLEDNSAAGRKRVADALIALHRYSLATVGGNRISVHRLLQKVIRDRLIGRDQASAITHALTAIQRAIPDDSKLPATWPQWQELAPHVVAI